LRKQGRLKTKPVGVTWGLDNCRDVHYAKAVADIVGFDWKHVSIGPECILENIREGFPAIGGLVPPSDLHRMLWFRDHVGKDALVLAGSYGDSIGRAEFSGRHLLELEYLKLSNPLHILKDEVVVCAKQGLSEDAEQLRRRAAGDTPGYALCEHQMQGIYMRNMIGHVMGIINQYCTLYQMFTAPEVYGYMWSLHPARRDDSIYAALLDNHLPELARLPWARNNKALSGKTVGANPALQKEFHDYAAWCSGPLYDEIKLMVDPDWFDSIGIFNPQAVRFLNQSLSPGSAGLKYMGMKPYSIWLWLAGFRVLYNKVIAAGKNIKIDEMPSDQTAAIQFYKGSRSKLRQFLGGNPVLYRMVSRLRRRWYKREAIRKYPPVYSSDFRENG